MQTAAVSMAHIKRAIRRGFQQISHDRSWGSTLLLLSSVMVLTQLFLLFMLGVHGVGTLLAARADIQLEVLDSAQDADVQRMYAALRAHPAVENVTFVPSEQAYEQQKARDPELIGFLEEYQLDNPFPDTFAVTLKSLDAYDSFIQEMQADEWHNVINPSFVSLATSQERDVRTLLQVTGGLRTLSVLFIVLAIVLLFFVIVEWAQRVANRRENELMLEHVLGAPGPSVLFPFTAELSMFLIAATVIGTLSMIAFMMVLPLFMPALALEALFTQLQTQLWPMLMTVLPFIVLIEIIAMPFLAFGGIALGVRKHMPASFTLLS